MNKVHLSIIGGVLATGFLIGILFFIVTKDDDNHNQTQHSFDHEAVEVTASDDGAINASKLFIPWTINKNGNTFYLSQRDGTVIEIDGEFGLVEVQEVALTKGVHHEGEGGFLGFTLDPEFETTNKAYAYHTYQEDGKTLNRIVSLVLDNNTWEEEDILLENIPGGEINNGGRIEVGPDGYLYATTGDTGEGETAQDLESLAGKILRLNVDGSVPEDNPFEDSYIYSYGHRNPQGFAWDEEGNLYSSEHGESGHDEINVIEAGKNYGWPVIQGDEEAPDMVSPIHHSGENTWAPSGMAYNDGQLYIASLAGKQLLSFDIESKEVSSYYDEAGRLRDVLVEGDALYLITNNHDSRGTPTDKDDQLIQLSLTATES